MFSEYSLLRELLIIQQTISIVCPSELPQIGNHVCGRLYFKYNVVFIGLIKIKDVIEVFWVRKYFYVEQASMRPTEMKNNLVRRATNYGILSATMVG